MEFLCIGISFVCVMGAYFYVSVREKSFVNVLTPTLAFLVPADYVLESYHLWLFGPSGSLLAYALIYACYAATFAAFAVGYSRSRVPPLKLPFMAPQGAGNPLAPYLVLAAAIALYLPVLLEFRSDLATPRLIYEQTRSGYGVYFFLSTTLCYMALILLLFKRRLRKLELTLFVIVCLVFLWLHGSKNQMLLVFFILSAHWVYVRKQRISLARFAVFGAFLVAVGGALFLLTNPVLLLGNEGLQGIAGYSDYTRNGMLVIDSDLGPLYGKLTLEQEIYSRIPRQLFPNKPNDFGALYLAAHFYPDAFNRDNGAPAFSFGTALADFGVLALPIWMFANLLAGILLKIFVTGVRRYADPGNFTLTLFASGLTLIPVSTSFILPESLALAIAIGLLHSLRLRPRRQSLTGPRNASPPTQP
jgi:hypothetical protein